VLIDRVDILKVYSQLPWLKGFPPRADREWSDSAKGWPWPIPESAPSSLPFLSKRRRYLSHSDSRPIRYSLDNDGTYAISYVLRQQFKSCTSGVFDSSSLFPQSLMTNERQKSKLLPTQSRVSSKHTLVCRKYACWTYASRTRSSTVTYELRQLAQVMVSKTGIWRRTLTTLAPQNFWTTIILISRLTVSTFFLEDNTAIPVYEKIMHYVWIS
jgi:hypothetical protein